MEKKKIEVDSIIPISSSLNDGFFRYWLESLKFIHHLTASQMDVLAAFLKHRHMLSKNISDPEILDKFTMSNETRRKVMAESKMSTTHFQVVMSALKKNKAIVDGRINPRLIPTVSDDATSFKLLIYFNLKDADNK